MIEKRGEEREIARVESRERKRERERAKGRERERESVRGETAWEGARGRERKGRANVRKKEMAPTSMGPNTCTDTLWREFVPGNVSRRRYLSSEGGRAFGGVEALAQMSPERVNQSKGKGSKGECADMKEAFSDKRTRRREGKSKGKKGNEEKRGRRESDA